MRDGVYKRVEIAANLAIITVAVMVGVALFTGYSPLRRPGGARLPADGQVRAGKKLSLPGVEWAKNGRTLLVALSPTCRYCTESAPFYQRLAREKAGARGGVSVIALLNQPASEGQKYLAGLGVALDDVRQAPLGELGIEGTPMLILVDGDGVVTNAWYGKLTAEKELEVLSQLQASGQGD